MPQRGKHGVLYRFNVYSSYNEFTPEARREIQALREKVTADPELDRKIGSDLMGFIAERMIKNKRSAS